MSNDEGRAKSTNSGRSAPRIERSAPNSGRSPLASPKFTAHRFREYRKGRGLLVQEMRKKRGLVQGDLGAPSQVRRYESGGVAQIATMELLARLVPCPREMMKFWKNALKHLPVSCVECRKSCRYKGLDEKAIAAVFMEDITDLELG